MKTILITGCSSGFGLEIARDFLKRGWNVIATMRSPREDLLPPSERLRVLPLDVTDPQSIRRLASSTSPASEASMPSSPSTPSSKVMSFYTTEPPSEASWT